MKYFKNTELAKIYNVSEKSVRNWIQAAREGKLDLELYEKSERFWVANTTKNTAIIELQVKKGKKFKNQRGRKVISPSKEFYEMYNKNQILDIISNLTIHGETPLQYTYVDGGADDWDKYAQRLIKEAAPNILNRTIEILETTSGTVGGLLSGYRKVNIIDIGPGNGLPIRSTIDRLNKEGRLKRYIPIDISTDMLSILERNIKHWFGGSVKYEPAIKDISHERFNDIIANDLMDSETINVVFLLGGTLSNFRSPAQVLQVIRDSMGLNDLFICSGYLDTPKTRRYFDYYSSNKRKVPVQDGLILDFLNIDESLYNVEQLFDEENRARIIRVRPKIDIAIRFDLDGASKTIELVKNEPILIWRHWHRAALETLQLLDANGFDIMQATKSRDQQYLVTVSKLKKTQE
ncbi:MAG TPA: L-histidine N(alpha)-methyltransferase [Candidatus Saccharimonadales bacterium]|nr:L-histidine N(alpha)-methyltransferase [Candidatus Saccharimonadales bacterium]